MPATRRGDWQYRIPPICLISPSDTGWPTIV